MLIEMILSPRGLIQQAPKIGINLMTKPVRGVEAEITEIKAEGDKVKVVSSREIETIELSRHSQFRPGNNH